MCVCRLKNLYLIFSHRLTDEQKNQAKEQLRIKECIYLPVPLQGLWSNIPPDTRSIKDYLAPIAEWLIGDARPGDFVLIQGDFGATYIMVNLALSKGLVPVYATTKRDAEEMIGPNGEIQLIKKFSHVQYRQYEKG